MNVCRLGFPIPGIDWATERPSKKLNLTLLDGRHVGLDKEAASDPDRPELFCRTYRQATPRSPFHPVGRKANRCGVRRAILLPLSNPLFSSRSERVLRKPANRVVLSIRTVHARPRGAWFSQLARGRRSFAFGSVYGFLRVENQQELVREFVHAQDELARSILSKFLADGSNVSSWTSKTSPISSTSKLTAPSAVRTTTFMGN